MVTFAGKPPRDPLADRIAASLATIRSDAERFRLYGQGPAADMLEAVADRLDAELGAYLQEPITPAQAEQEGLCDPETVRRRVRDGTLANVGTEARIRVRRGDVEATARRGGGGKAGGRKGGQTFAAIARGAVAGAINGKGKGGKR